MFVHDFSPVAQPVDTAVRSFGAAAAGPTLAEIVKRAWNEEAPMLAALIVDRPGVRASHVEVEISGHRLRGDAAIVNIRWRGDGWLPELDADLEIVAFGRQATHLHLMGRYELPEGVERFGPTGSLMHRVMVVVVRQFLNDLGDLLALQR